MDNDAKYTANKPPTNMTLFHQFCQKKWTKIPANYCEKLEETQNIWSKSNNLKATLPNNKDMHINFSLWEGLQSGFRIDHRTETSATLRRERGTKRRSIHRCLVEITTETGGGGGASSWTAMETKVGASFWTAMEWRTGGDSSSQTAMGALGDDTMGEPE